MTHDEFTKYKNIAINVFNYMNGTVNVLNKSCIIDIDAYDNVYQTYGNIRFPNHIYIHIGTIVDSWDDMWSVAMKKDEYVVSCICWAICHELHHADQLISMIRYNQSEAYKNDMEIAVDHASYYWVMNHSIDLRRITGVNIKIGELTSSNIEDVSSSPYRKAKAKEFYLQTIANTILRDINLFSSLKIFTDDKLCDDIILVFNDYDSVIIKSGGNYIESNIPYFSQLAYKWAGMFDSYRVKATVNPMTGDNGRIVMIVNFHIEDMCIYPIITNTVNVPLL